MEHWSIGALQIKQWYMKKVHIFLGKTYQTYMLQRFNSLLPNSFSNMHKIKDENSEGGTDFKEWHLNCSSSLRFLLYEPCGTNSTLSRNKAIEKYLKIIRFWALDYQNMGCKFSTTHCTRGLKSSLRCHINWIIHNAPKLL